MARRPAPRRAAPDRSTSAAFAPIRWRAAAARSSPPRSLPRRARHAVGRFLRGLPDILAARDLRAVAHAIAARHRAGRTVVLGMGAHPIKVGLSPLIIDLMRRGIVTAVAMNGAGIIHDFELAYHGETSEDVAAALVTGQFGMAEETGRFLNQAITRAATHGLGAAVGEAILDARLPYRTLSILAAGARLGVPVTVHVAVGTDIIHMHPCCRRRRHRRRQLASISAVSPPSASTCTAASSSTSARPSSSPRSSSRRSIWRATSANASASW